MSPPLTSPQDETPTVTLLARAVVPVLVASAVTALVLVAVRAEPVESAGDPSAAPPTPYSEMHARVQQSPGEPEPLPPTF